MATNRNDLLGAFEYFRRVVFEDDFRVIVTNMIKTFALLWPSQRKSSITSVCYCTPQVGLPSSHFTFRVRHFLQPLFDLGGILFLRSSRGGLPDGTYPGWGDDGPTSCLGAMRSTRSSA